MEGILVEKYSFSFIVLLILIGCAGYSILGGFSSDNPAKIGFTFELTEPSQMVVIDSIGSKLISRLLLFSKERGDYVLVKGDDKKDYLLRLKVIDFHLVSKNKQTDLAATRNKIENKYDAIRDSIEMGLRGKTDGKKVAAGIVANAAINMLTMPLGFMTVIMPNTQAGHMSVSDKQRVYTTYSTSRLTYETTLETSEGRVVWKKSGEEEFTLTYVVPEQEQINILTRNVVLSLEDKIPLLKIP